MALSYTSAIAALLNDGKSKQVLPISMANLIELSKEKNKFGDSAQSVQDALSYLAGSFEHANTVAKTAENNAYAYVGTEIGKLDVNAVGSQTKEGHEKYISYIWEKDGKIEAFAKEMTAANVAYSGGDNRATVAAELGYINSTIANNLTATTLKLVKTGSEGKDVVTETVSADGTEYRLKQGDTVVAKFNIEKDSFVKSGSVVRGTADEKGNFTSEDPNGKYFIKLEIRTHDDTGAGAAEHTLYIPAESLVDAYTADNYDWNKHDSDGNAKISSVKVTVDKNKNTIGAVIIEGGVGTKELAADAVITEKIADKNVTKAKLEDTVQASLDKADTAVQNIATGTTAGTISVDGRDVKVKDLKTVATSGKASDVTITEITELNAIAGSNQHVDDVQEALAALAGKVKAINDGTVTSVKTSVVDNGKDTQNAVTISMTPVAESKGAVTVELTHNLGSAAALDYDMKAVATPVSEGFWNSVK